MRRKCPGLLLVLDVLNRSPSFRIPNLIARIIYRRMEFLVTTADADESYRLATLRSLNVLDTPAEERFDRLARLARKLFDVPVAAVSLVDSDRTWFKSCFGADVESVPREISFCTHALSESEILMIPDAEADPRFSDNPLVISGPKYRFYVGCPLRMANGAPMGTLCLLDTKPREFAAEDLVFLRDLAEMAERELAALAMATTDDLTGLSNRRGFLALGQQALNVCQRANRPATLLMFDLDYFKRVNDEFGHAEGDQVLRSFSNLLTKVFRSSDVIARLGGDEFLVLLTNTDPDGLQPVLERFHEGLDALNRSHERDYEIACSIGMLGIDVGEQKSLDTLLAEADGLMYASKQLRR